MRDNKSTGSVGGLSSQAVREGLSEEGNLRGKQEEARWTSKERHTRQRACKGGARRRPGANTAPDTGITGKGLRRTKNLAQGHGGAEWLR